MLEFVMVGIITAEKKEDAILRDLPIKNTLITTLKRLARDIRGLNNSDNVICNGIYVEEPKKLLSFYLKN